MDSCAPAVGTLAQSAVLRRHVLLVHRELKKRPAASIWSGLPAATRLPAAPPRRVETPLVEPGDSGSTRQSRQVNGLTAELEAGCSEEGNPPPCCSPRQLVARKCRNREGVSANAGPLQHSEASTKKHRRADCHSARSMFAWEDSCSARCAPRLSGGCVGW